jgi:hypothetical protein
MSDVCGSEVVVYGGDWWHESANMPMHATLRERIGFKLLNQGLGSGRYLAKTMIALMWGIRYNFD